MGSLGNGVSLCSSTHQQFLTAETGLVAGFMNCVEDLMCPYGLYKMLLAASRIKIN